MSLWRTLSATAARGARGEGWTGVVAKARWTLAGETTQSKNGLAAALVGARNNVSETSCAEYTTKGHSASVKQLAGAEGAFGFNLKSVIALSTAAAAVQAAQWKAADCQAPKKAEEEEAKENASLKELPTEPVTLYSYEVCPFCNKVRAFLDYNDIPYSVVEVNPLTKAEVKGMKKNKEGKLKVPIVGLAGSKAGEEQLVESDDIIDAFERVLPKNSGKKSGAWFGSNKSAADESAREMQEWRTWVNERFVHVLTINIYRNVEESFETFDYITHKGNFDFVAREAARYGGAGIMYFVSNYSIKKKRNLPGDERSHLYEDIAKWVKALDGKDFLGGKKPSLADLSMFGVIRTIEGFKTFKDMMKNTEIAPWYDRMAKAVGASSRLN